MHHAMLRNMMDAGSAVGTQMLLSYARPTVESCADAPLPRGKTHLNRAGDTAFLGLVLWTLMHAAQAAAGDQGAASGAAPPAPGNLPHPVQLSALMDPIPDPFRTAEAVQSSSRAAEFRPRGRSSAQPVDLPRPADDESIMRSSTVWDRLTESKSHDGVELVTLWHTGGNSLSLQAGRKGDPTLQWTSRLMNRGRGPHGLLDDWFSRSLDNAAVHGLHLPSRGATAEAPPKPKSADTVIPGAGDR